MEDLTELTLENEELKKEIKKMRAEMDRMSESMQIMENQNAEGTSTVRQMTQMFEAMQRSAEKRSMMDTTETAATPGYPPGFTQGMMPVTVHLNKPVQQVDPPEVQWPLYGLPPNYTPPIANNASNQTAKPQGSDAKVADSQLPPQQGSTTNVVRFTPTPSAQQVLNYATPSSQEKGSTAAVLGVTPACNVQWLPGQQATNFGMPNQSVNFGAATGEGKSIDETQLRHGGPSVNAVEEEEQCMRRKVEDVKTPLRVIFKRLCKAGLIEGNATNDRECGLHPDAGHALEDCEEFKQVLQDMMDRKLIQIGCCESIVDVSVIDYSASTPPRPLVIHYARDATVRTTNGPKPITIQIPTSFPYKDNKAVPWKYGVEVLVDDSEDNPIGEANVDTPNVTNIAGFGGITRSGRIYTPDEFKTTQSSEVVEEKEKGKETSFQALEIAHTTYEKPKAEPQPSDALMMVARVMLENGYQYGRGLGRYEQGVSQMPNFVGKQDKFGLGYKPSSADVKRLVEEKEEKRFARLGGREPRTGGVPICDIKESFISAGFEHSILIAAAEEHTQEDWVRVGPTEAKLPNWEIVELPVIFNFK
ncbi:G-patch domain [Sesbania bispinosa]|nr:G-patch domain [Sesbania bispinosa]